MHKILKNCLFERNFDIFSIFVTMYLELIFMSHIFIIKCQRQSKGNVWVQVGRGSLVHIEMVRIVY